MSETWAETPGNIVCSVSEQQQPIYYIIRRTEIIHGAAYLNLLNRELLVEQAISR